MKRVLVSLLVVSLLVLSAGTAVASLADIQGYFRPPQSVASYRDRVVPNLTDAQEAQLQSDVILQVESVVQGVKGDPNWAWSTAAYVGIINNLQPFVVDRIDLAAFHHNLRPASRAHLVDAVEPLMALLEAQGITEPFSFAFVTVRTNNNLEEDFEKAIAASVGLSLGTGAGELPPGFLAPAADILLNAQGRYNLTANESILTRSDFSLYGVNASPGPLTSIILNRISRNLPHEFYHAIRAPYPVGQTVSIFSDLESIRFSVAGWQNAFISLRPVADDTPPPPVNGGSSGGCSVSTMGALALLLLPVLAIVRRRK